MDILKLRRMANQIAANFEATGHDNAVLATADHINKFWDPRMKSQIFADDWSQLSPVTAAAIEKLAKGADPAPQTGATDFNAVDEVGANDAG